MDHCKLRNNDYYNTLIHTSFSFYMYFCRMTTSAFESMRLIAIIVAVLLKFVLMPMYLQSYLNLAMQRLENQKKEAGRITNVDLQKKVSKLSDI